MIFTDRLLFLHVPKAGGSSVVSHLLDVLPRPVHHTLPAGHQADLPPGVTRLVGSAHEGLAEARIVLGSRGIALEDLDVIIACVRDPYELEVSRYEFLRQDRHAYNHGAEQALALLGDFELFAECSRPHGQRALESYYELDGAVPDNLRIVRLERVAEELPDALAQIGLDTSATPVPHYNRSTHEQHLRYYTPAAERAVHEKYKWVFGAGLYRRMDLGPGGPAPSRYADPAAVDDLLEGALRGARDELSRTYGWLAAAAIHRHHLRPVRQRDALERALVHARSVDSPRLRGITVQDLARCWSLVGPGTASAGIAACAALVQADDAPMGTCAARLAAAELLAASGRPADAQAMLDRARAEGPEMMAAAVGAAAGSIELLAGDPEEAERLLPRGTPSNPHFAGDRTEALLRLGRHAEAEPIVAAAERTVPAADLRARARWGRARARLDAASGATDRASATAADAVALIARCDAPNLHADALTDLATVLSAAGRDEEAAAAADRAAVLYERKGNVVAARLAAR